jgi:regulatory protein
MRESKDISPENAFLRLATLCARCEQAEGDLRKKLRDWKIGISDANAIIERLKAERYLDNERFANAYCRDKLRFNGWGRIKISFMLKGKGIEQDYIDAAIAMIDEEKYCQILDDALETKLKTLKDKTPGQTRSALMRFAASRGFEPNLIFPAIDKLMNYNDEI